MQDKDESLRTTFNPHEHFIQIKSRDKTADYLPVQWRLVWFREQVAGGTIDTELVAHNPDQETVAEGFAWNNETRRSEKVTKHAKGWAMFKATVCDGDGNCATGHGSEGAADFPDYLEKAETKSVGRALAMLGYGTQFAPELDEGTVRIVDAPVERKMDVPTKLPASNGTRDPRPSGGTSLASTAQVEMLYKQYQVPRDITSALEKGKYGDQTSEFARFLTALQAARQNDDYKEHAPTYIREALTKTGLANKVTGDEQTYLINLVPAQLVAVGTDDDPD